MPYDSIVFVANAGGYPDSATKAFSTGELYPTTRFGLTFGNISSTATCTNVSGTGQPLLSGRMATNTAARRFRVDLPGGPGTYRLRMALGTLNTNVTVGALIYDAATGGNLLHTVPDRAVNSGQVLDINGTVHTSYANWAANRGYVELTLPGSIFIAKSAATQLQIVNVEFEQQSTPLDPLQVKEFQERGSLAGAIPDLATIYAGQPSGEPFGRIVVPTGLDNDLSIVGGGLQSYLSIQTINSQRVLVHNGTRIPDSATPTLTLRQVTPGETKDTAFSFTLVPAGARPTTGILGRITTQTWLNRKTVKDQTDQCWPGYTGQAFVSDVSVNSAATFATAYNAITPNGTGWYRIRLQNGTYASAVILNNKDFGTGGILIEPEAGNDPDFSVTWSTVVRGLHMRNVRSSLNGGATIAFRFNDPGSGSSYFNNVVIENCQIGRLYRAGAVDSDVLTTSSYSGTAIYFAHGESLILRNNDFLGCAVGASINGVRRFLDQNNRARKGIGDKVKCAQAITYTSTFGVFADNHCYWYREGDTTHQQLDYDGFSSEAHQDNAQISTFGQNMSNWYKQTGTDGRQGISGAGIQKNWQVGDLCYNQGNNRIYRVKTAPTTSANGHPGGITGPTMPTAFSTPGDTSANVPDGELVWEFVAANPFTASTLYIHWEGCVVHSAAYSATGNPASTQFFINSNGGFDMPVHASFVNCLGATPNPRGIDNYGIKVDIPSRDASQNIIPGVTTTVGTVRNKTFAEFCSWVNSARVPAARQVNLGANFAVSGVELHARNNIVGQVQTPTDYSIASQYGDLVVVWNSSASGGNIPSANLRGGAGITTYGDGRYGYAALLDDRGLSVDELRSTLSKVVHSNSGAAGAKLREVHTVTLSGTGGPQDFELVIVP